MHESNCVWFIDMSELSDPKFMYVLQNAFKIHERARFTNRTQLSTSARRTDMNVDMNVNGICNAMTAVKISNKHFDRCD